MKKLLILPLCFLIGFANAQIAATTSAGKKVILNADGTWKYAQPTDSELACIKNHTGNITIKNATSSDIYFYYSTDDYGKAEFIKVKSNTTRTISDLLVGIYNFKGELTQSYNYKWKATLEMAEVTSNFAYIQGAIEKGAFIVEQCTLKEVSVGE